MLPGRYGPWFYADGGHQPTNDRGQVEAQAGVYPTGRFLVIKKEVALKAFGDIGSDKAYVDAAMFNRLCPAE